MFASSATEVSTMIAEWRMASAEVAGRELRLEQCKWAQVRRSDDRPYAVGPELPALYSMDGLTGRGAQGPRSRCTPKGRVAARTPPHDGNSSPLKEGALARLGNTHGRKCESSTWARSQQWHGRAAKGNWTATELRRIVTVQQRKTRRIAQWRPSTTEDRPEFAKRCSAWSQKPWTQAGEPS